MCVYLNVALKVFNIVESNHLTCRGVEKDIRYSIANRWSFDLTNAAILYRIKHVRIYIRGVYIGCQGC